jgi:hypothetical protein
VKKRFDYKDSLVQQAELDGEANRMTAFPINDSNTWKKAGRIIYVGSFKEEGYNKLVLSHQSL